MSKPTFRNRLAHWIADTAFRYIADDEYEREIEMLLKYGVRSAARDVRDGSKPLPTLEELGIPDWGRFRE